MNTASRTTTDQDTHAFEEPVRRFLAAIAGGTGMPADLFTPDAVLDATVPNWRLERAGDEAICAELSSWYCHPMTIERVVHRPFDGGVAIEVDLSWNDGGVPHAGHQMHVLTIEDGAVARHTIFCGGRWGADLLAEMEAARAH